MDLKKLKKISKDLGSLKSQIDDMCGMGGEEEEDMEEEEEEGDMEDAEEESPKGKEKKVDLMVAFLGKKKKK